MTDRVLAGLEVYATEACEGFLPWSKGVAPGSWARAETCVLVLCLRRVPALVQGRRARQLGPRGDVRTSASSAVHRDCPHVNARMMIAVANTQRQHADRHR